jgi:hypothetical protein
VVEIGSDSGGMLKLARQRCTDLRGTDAPPGFPPLVQSSWTNQVKLATTRCPDCGHDRPDIVEEDLDWSQERCSRCQAAYERSNVLLVIGEEKEAGYAWFVRVLHDSPRLPAPGGDFVALQHRT